MNELQFIHGGSIFMTHFFNKKIVFFLSIFALLEYTAAMEDMINPAAPGPAQAVVPLRELTNPQVLAWMHTEGKHEAFVKFVERLDAQYSDSNTCYPSWQNSGYRGIIEKAAFAIFQIIPNSEEWNLSTPPTRGISIVEALEFQKTHLVSFFSLVLPHMHPNNSEHEIINLLMTTSTVSGVLDPQRNYFEIVQNSRFMNCMFPSRDYQLMCCILGAQMWLRQAKADVAERVMQQVGLKSPVGLVGDLDEWNPMNWRKIEGGMGYDLTKGITPPPKIPFPDRERGTDLILRKLSAIQESLASTPQAGVSR
jgi:hypothetical protein